MRIEIEDLRTKMLATIGEGFARSEAERIVEVLLWADMAGVSTMGVVKLISTNPLQDIVPIHEVQIERETPVSVLLNAGANPAPLVSQIATDYAIEKAMSAGMSIVGVHNVFSSTLAQAFFGRRIADAGLIGIVQSRPAVSTTTGFGSIDPLFGTNPIAFSFPTKGAPLIFDMTTSAITWSGLVLAEAQGKNIPDNVAIDSFGNTTTSPSEAMRGALLPFASGHKTAALALVVDILGGVLPGATYGDTEGEWGASFIAIDPEMLIGREVFKARCSDLIKRIKSSRKQPGVEEVRLPGERANEQYQQSLASGMVDVDEFVLAKLGYA